jgi:transcriptional regulator with XRE-family HTH domain
MAARASETPRAAAGESEGGGDSDTGGEAQSTARARAADRHVGSRIRERRVMLGFSQQQLAELIGVTYQQAHKYERGLNRISAGRLYEIALVLNVPVSWFFEGLSAGQGVIELSLRVPISWFYEGLDSPALPTEMSARERACLELARNFVAIENEKFQEALSQMARALAARSRAESESS